MKPGNDNANNTRLPTRAKDALFVGLQFLLFAAYAAFASWPAFDTMVWFTWAAWAITVGGGVVALVAALTLKTNLSPFPSPVARGRLIRSGVYAHMRHPIYTGLIMAAFGYGVATHNGIQVGIAFVLLGLFFFKARYEERLLKQRFAEYPEYVRSTGMLFPKIRRRAALVIVIALPMLVYVMTAQRKVESAAYDSLLRVTLAHTVPEIGAQDIGAADSALFLDARAYREYQVSHMANALYVGYDDFDLTRVEDVPRNQRIIVYCSIGYRSEKIAERLIAAGFTDVANLYGGIFEWMNQGRAVYDSVGQTERVHAYDKVWGLWLTRGAKVFDER